LAVAGGSTLFSFSQAIGAFAGIVALGGALLLTGAATSQHFGVIDAGRINIREPDGTLRLVISSAALAPGIIVKNHEQPHPSRDSAGMIFFNDEGTENGGLIFGGQKSASGKTNSYGSLTFDRYEQDQVVQITGQEDGSNRYSGLLVFDEPDAPIDFAAIERARRLSGAAQHQAFVKANAAAQQRAFFGRDASGASQVVLRDAKGAKRLILQVTASGTAQVQFLDAAGKVLKTIDATHN
jgi:hypothetical protein